MKMSCNSNNNLPIMNTHPFYITVSEALIKLSGRGYTVDFLREAQKVSVLQHTMIQSLAPTEFAIDEVYRFDGMTDPGDEMVVYAISSLNNASKGFVLNAYGMYADTESFKLVERLVVE